MKGAARGSKIKAAFIKNDLSLEDILFSFFLGLIGV
jgi:hypothetical protein